MKRLAAFLSLSVLSSLVLYTYSSGPRPWPRGAWNAADHNRDGQLTRSEMIKFSQQKPHRNSARLLWHFDSADINCDQIVDAAEVDIYGTAIGSKDPNDHLPPPKRTESGQSPSATR